MLYLARTIGRPFNLDWKTYFTSSATGKIPHSPEKVKGYRDTTGNLTIAFIPRARYNFEWANYVEAPITDQDVCDVDILNGSGDVVMTLTSVEGVHEVEYTTAQQTTDFGSVQFGGVTVRVRQRGTLIPQGYFKEAIV
jgi:hypothetical protein